MTNLNYPSLRALLFFTVIIQPASLALAEDWIEKIELAWEAREKRLVSVECHWEETRAYLPGGLIPAAVAQQLELQDEFPHLDMSVGWPNENISVTQSVELRLQGNWMYFDEFSVSPNTDPKEPYRLNRMVTAFDGEKNVTLSVNAVIDEASANSSANVRHLLPLRCHLRPLQSSFEAVRLEDCTVKSVTDDCIVLVDKKRVRELHIDPARDFSVFYGLDRDPSAHRPLTEFEVNLVEDQGEWRPASWTITNFKIPSDRELSSVFSATVTDWRVGVSFSKTDFQQSIPSSVPVFDRTDFAQSSGQQAIDDITTRRTLFWANLLLLGVFLSFVVYQMKRRRRA